MPRSRLGWGGSPDALGSPNVPGRRSYTSCALERLDCEKPLALEQDLTALLNAPSPRLHIPFQPAEFMQQQYGRP